MVQIHPQRQKKMNKYQSEVIEKVIAAKKHLKDSEEELENAFKDEFQTLVKEKNTSGLFDLMNQLPESVLRFRVFSVITSISRNNSV